MSTPVIVVITVGAVALVAVTALLLARRGSSGAARRMCGGCQRAMASGWEQCMFCGWAPMARLEFLSGPLAHQVMYLQDEVTTVGSAPGTTIVLSDAAVSRKHAAIRRVGGSYELADLGSTNGIYVNGHKLPKKTLASGDVLRVGTTEMVFRRD